MANIRKTFNFRNGVQVDEDNLIVNSAGLVGIGTSVPTAFLDVRGRVSVVGLVTATEVFANNIGASGVSTFSGGLRVGIVSISESGIITATSTSGVVTYYGDGGRLLNLPTSQWLDVNPGLGFTSIYAQGFVGVGTNDPRFIFQVAGTPDTSLVGFSSGVGISSEGNILATGIVTAYKFSGSGSDITSINADNISTGTIGINRIPVLTNSKFPSNIDISGIVTARTHFAGNLVGIASTAIGITSTSIVNIAGLEVGFTTSTTLTVGIATFNTRIYSAGSVGIQTNAPQSDIHITKTGISSIQLTGSTETYFTFGRSLNQRQNTAGLKFGNITPFYAYSNQNAFDLINYDTGNFNQYLHYGESGVGTGSFNWIYGKDPSNPLMSLTYDGKLGIGLTNPGRVLEVNGIGTFNSDLFVQGDLFVNDQVVVNSSIKCSSLDVPQIVSNIKGNITVPDFPAVGFSTFNNLRITGITTISGRGLSVNVSTTPLGIDQSLRVNNGGSAFVVTIAGDIGIKTDKILYDGIDVDCTNASVMMKAVGVGSTTFKSAVDFSSAGKGETVSGFFEPGCFMVVPKVSTATRDAFPAPIAGGIIYNTTTNKFQGYTGIGWSDFH